MIAGGASAGRVRKQEKRFEVDDSKPTTGEVAKRSNAADCKSVALAASKVRVLPSPPSFARFAGFGWQARRPAHRSATREGGSYGAQASGGCQLSVRARYAGLPAEAPNSGVSERVGGSNSVVESQPSKLLVAGSIPVSRSILCQTLTAFAASDGKPVSVSTRSGQVGVGD